jgi:gliding motility-associated-like protein
VCDGESITLLAQQPPGDPATGYRYVWYKNDALTAVEGSTLATSELGVARYKAVAVSSEGCASAFSNTRTVSVQPIPVAVVAPDRLELCDGAEGFLQASPIDPALTYVWYKNGTLMAGSSQDYLHVLSTGAATADYTDSYRVDISNGVCSSSGSAPVVVHARPTTPVVSPATANVCALGNVTLTATAAGALTFEWYRAALGAPTYALDTLTHFSIYSKYGLTLEDAGSYAVEAVSYWGCRSPRSEAVSVNIMPAPQAYFTGTLACSNATTFNEVAPQGGQFFGPGCSNPATFNPSEAGAGSFTVGYLYTSPNGCTATASQTLRVIEQPGTPAIYTDQPTQVCAGSADVTVTLRTTALSSTYSYQWYKDGNALPAATGSTYTAQSRGTYTLQVVNEGRCPAVAPSAAIAIGEYPPTPAPTVAADAAGFCPDGSVLLAVQPPTSGIFEWARQDGALITPIPNALGSTYEASHVGTYTARLLDGYGCYTPHGNAVAVVQHPLPAKPVITSSATLYHFGLNYTLSLQPTLANLRYEWFRNSINTGVADALYPIWRLKGEDVASYDVRTVNEYGCEVWSDRYTISNASELFFIPNVFTPNGDGVNDYFEIVGLNAFADNRLQILNKGGKVIFAVSNYQNDWGGGGYPTDVYYYALEVIDAGGNSTVHRGFVHLKR